VQEEGVPQWSKPSAIWLLFLSFYPAFNLRSRRRQSKIRKIRLESTLHPAHQGLFQPQAIVFHTLHKGAG